MSHSLLAFNINEIKVKPGQVTFNGFEDLKNQAIQLAEEIKNVQVTEENVQTSKKMLAAVNKRIKEISDKRISIKKDMLEPYNEFESQVNEITSIVKDADDLVRKQVKQMEEDERVTKGEKIKEIFNKRVKQYSFNDAFSVVDFITPQHLNKSKTMKSVETEMVEWLEKKDADMIVINSLPNAQEVFTEYLDTKDLTVAMSIVNRNQERMKEAEKVIKPKKSLPDSQYEITVFDVKDLKMIEMFMQQNDIKYKTQKGIK